MARPKKQLNRRQDILDAARFIFQTKNFEKVTIDEIAQKAGIAKGSVYLEFKNKDDILVSMVEKEANSYLDVVAAKMKDFKPPYLDFIKKMYEIRVNDAFEMTTSHECSYVDLMNTNYKIKSATQNIHKRAMEIIAYILKKAAQNGEIEPQDDYFRIAHCINICAQGFFPPYDLKYSVEHRKDLSKYQIKELLMKDAKTVVNMILYGLTSRKNEKLK